MLVLLVRVHGYLTCESVDHELDSMCNFVGDERWVSKFENVFHDGFLFSEHVPWVIEHSGRVAGTVKTAGGGGHTAENVTFLTVDEAG